MFAKTTTITKTDSSTKTKLAPQYKVLLHNDDINSMDHVVISLIKVFKFEINKCISIMAEAHETGVALCKIEPMEHAELHCEQLQALFLISTIEPE